MSIQTFQPVLGVTVSDKAAQHIQAELAKNAEQQGFRLYLETSGCSGFMYETELVEAPKADDEVFELNGVKVFIPRKDLPILNGTEIDFITVGLNSMLQFRNPNVTGECGCGESFSVTEEP